MSGKNLRFAVFGAGFWAHFQLGAWYELEGVKCVAIYNRTLAHGKALAARFGVPVICQKSFVSSIVPCNAHLLRVLRGESKAETEGEDNLKTIELTYAVYESARTDSVVHLNHAAHS